VSPKPDPTPLPNGASRRFAVAVADLLAAEGAYVESGEGVGPLGEGVVVVVHERGCDLLRHGCALLPAPDLLWITSE
jgi:hypothetical protein